MQLSTSLYIWSSIFVGILVAFAERCCVVLAALSFLVTQIVLFIFSVAAWVASHPFLRLFRGAHAGMNVASDTFLFYSLKR